MMHEHFEEELKILEKGLDKSEDPENELVIKDYIPCIREILDICEKQGHSGFSIQHYAGHLSEVIKNAMLLKPISPLTGEDDEWFIHDNDVGCYAQNKRNSAVFKEKSGKAYFLDAIYFSGEDEYDTFTGSVCGVYSSQYIKKFPFVAKTFKIDVYREEYDPNKHGENAEVSGCGDGDYVYFIKDEKQLEEVWKYYDKFEKSD